MSYTQSTGSSKSDNCLTTREAINACISALDEVQEPFHELIKLVQAALTEKNLLLKDMNERLYLADWILAMDNIPNKAAEEATTTLKEFHSNAHDDSHVALINLIAETHKKFKDLVKDYEMYMATF